MFWGLSAGVVDTGDFSFEHVLEDIQTLNEWALEGRLEVTAISLHAYPFVQDRYDDPSPRGEHGLGLRADRGVVASRSRTPTSRTSRSRCPAG